LREPRARLPANHKGKLIDDSAQLQKLLEWQSYCRKQQQDVPSWENFESQVVSLPAFISPSRATLRACKSTRLVVAVHETAGLGGTPPGSLSGISGRKVGLKGPQLLVRGGVRINERGAWQHWRRAVIRKASLMSDARGRPRHLRSRTSSTEHLRIRVMFTGGAPQRTGAWGLRESEDQFSGLKGHYLGRPGPFRPTYFKGRRLLPSPTTEYST